MGSTSGRPSRKIRNISTVHTPTPRTWIKRSTSSWSDRRLASASEGTIPARVLRARSFMAATLAPDNPALRSTDLRRLSIRCGAGGRPPTPRERMRRKMVAAAALPAGDGLIGNRFQKDFVRAPGPGRGDVTLEGGLYQAGELGVARGKMALGVVKIERKPGGRLGHGFLAQNGEGQGYQRGHAHGEHACGRDGVSRRSFSKGATWAGG